MRFIFDPNGDETVMHVELHNPAGEPVGRPMCGAPLIRPRTCNLPLGQPKCPECMKAVTDSAFTRVRSTP